MGKTSFSQWIKNAVEFCAQDDLGSSGSVVQYHFLTVQKISNTRFEIMHLKSGDVFTTDQHGNVINTKRNKEREQDAPGGTTLSILRIINDAPNPYQARLDLIAKYPERKGNSKKTRHGHYRVIDRCWYLDRKGLIDIIPFESSLPNAPPVNGYRLTAKGKDVLNRHSR